MGDGMNCKPGDLALIVKSLWPENLGKLVEVVELEHSDVWVIRHFTDFVGVIYGKVRTFRAGGESTHTDEGLRPIRDNPGQDETLSWCPVPTKETT
jgi:hypothetical protein